MKKVLLMLLITITSVISNVQAINHFDMTEQDTIVNNILTSINVKDSLTNTTPYIIKFYDIDRIQIKNDSNHLIRIFDEQWNLIYQTKNDVNCVLNEGSYYVACDCKIKKYYFKNC